jgi:hypothetical protein
MKAKDFIIIGGAIALYYLYQKNKTKTSTTSDEEAQDEATSGGGAGGGGGMPMPITPKPIILTPPTRKPQIVKGETTTGGEAIFTGATPIRSITNPEPVVTPIESAIQNGGASTLPRPNVVVTPTTNITNPEPVVTPIEVAIQQGGASTNPRPNIASEPSALYQSELMNQNIQPIVRGGRSL